MFSSSRAETAFSEHREAARDTATSKSVLGVQSRIIHWEIAHLTPPRPLPRRSASTDPGAAILVEDLGSLLEQFTGAVDPRLRAD